MFLKSGSWPLAPVVAGDGSEDVDVLGSPISSDEDEEDETKAGVPQVEWRSRRGRRP